MKSQIVDTPLPEMEIRFMPLKGKFAIELRKLKEQAENIPMYVFQTEIMIDAVESQLRNVLKRIDQMTRSKTDAITEKLRDSGRKSSHDGFILDKIEYLVKPYLTGAENSDPDEEDLKTNRRKFQERNVQGIVIAEEHGWQDREERLQEYLKRLRNDEPA